MFFGDSLPVNLLPDNSLLGGSLLDFLALPPGRTVSSSPLVAFLALPPISRAVSSSPLLPRLVFFYLA